MPSRRALPSAQESGLLVSRRRQNTGESQKGQGLCSSLLIQSGSAKEDRLSVSFREGRRTGRGAVAAAAGGGAHGPSASPHCSRGWTKSAAPRAEWDGIFILQQ